MRNMQVDISPSTSRVEKMNKNALGDSEFVALKYLDSKKIS